MPSILFYFLLQVSKALCLEKLLYRNVQPVAYLFNCGHGGAVISPGYYVVEGGLGYAADGGKLVYGYVMLMAELDYPLPNGHTYRHFYSP